MSAYLTKEDADTYFANRMFAGAWSDASEENKDKALAHATSLLERLAYVGTKTDENQEFQFPRNDETTIPQNILDACCEIALQLLNGVDPEKEVQAISVESQGFGPVRSTYDREFVSPRVRAGIPSEVAWTLILQYLKDGNKLIINRVG